MSEFVMVPRDLLEKAAGMVESYSACVAAYVKADDLERWDYVPGIDDCAEDLRAALAAAPPSPPPSSVKAREIDAFEAGYIQGHDATVEGRYADPSDAAQDYVRTLLVPAVDERAASSEPEMCPNCVTPWKCNGPHEFPQAASSEAAVAFDAERFERAPCYLCGYNGRGYYQPETHPCAAKYHAHPAPTTADAGVTEAAIARLSEARYQALLWAVLQCNEIGTCHGEPFNRNYAVQDNILCMAARKLGIMDWRDMRNDLDASALPAPTTADAGVTEAMVETFEAKFLECARTRPDSTLRDDIRAALEAALGAREVK